MAMRNENKKSKSSNIGSSSLLLDSHVGDKEYFSFWNKTGPFDDLNIAELFAMIEEAKRNTVVPEIPTKRMKKKTVEDPQSLCFPMNDNEVTKNNGEASDDGYCERKRGKILGEQNLGMPEIPTKRIKRETIEDDQSLCVPINDNEVAKNNGEGSDDGGNDDYCNRKTEQIVDHPISIMPVPKGQKSTDVVRTSDEKDQNDSIVNLKPDKKRNFSTDILKYFSVVFELERDVCQRSLDYLSEYKTANNLQKFFPVIEKKENPESKSQEGGILFKREGN